MFGGVEEFNALAYGMPRAENIRYFQNQYNNLVNNAKYFVGDIGRQFVQTATNIYNNYVSPDALARVRNIIYHVSDNKEQQIISELVRIEEIQKASTTMQRWIMACPEVRTLYHQQKIDGYSDTYVDKEPDAVGYVHYDYRLVTEGVLRYTYDEDGEINGTIISQYWMEDQLEENDRLLSIDEKVDILSTWDVIRGYLNHTDLDPTSPGGGYR